LSGLAAAASSPAELISDFRLKHGEGRVTMDATLNRIALEQAKAMAAKDTLDHEVLGSFNSRIVPARAGGLRKISRMATTVSKNARSMDRLERTSQKSPAPQGVPRRRRQREKRDLSSHLLGNGDRGRL
jgi:hypothetical protein